MSEVPLYLGAMVLADATRGEALLEGDQPECVEHATKCVQDANECVQDATSVFKTLTSVLKTRPSVSTTGAMMLADATRGKALLEGDILLLLYYSQA